MMKDCRRKKNAKQNDEFLAYAGLYSPSREQLITESPKNLTPGMRLRRERYIRHESIAELAEYLNISASYLGALERGTRSFSKKMLDICHEKLNLSYDYIINGELFSEFSMNMMVQDSEDFSSRKKSDLLLDSCSPYESDTCYHLIHTFLSQHRTSDPDHDQPKH